MKKRFLTIAVISVMLLTLCSCEFKLPKIKKKIPEIESVTFSDTDINFLNTKHLDSAVDVQNSLIENTSFINDLYKIANKYRQDSDKDILEFDSSLSIIATIRAQEIAKSVKFSHHRPDNKGYFSTLYQEYGFTSGNAGENIVKATSAEEALNKWQNSSSHNACILNNGWLKTGIGIAEMENGTYIWVQEFAS